MTSLDDFDSDRRTIKVEFGSDLAINMTYAPMRWTLKFATELLPKMNNQGMLQYLGLAWDLTWGERDVDAYEHDISLDESWLLVPPPVAGETVPLTALHMMRLPVFVISKIAEAVAEDVRQMGKLKRSPSLPG